MSFLYLTIKLFGGAQERLQSKLQGLSMCCSEHKAKIEQSKR